MFWRVLYYSYFRVEDTYDTTLTEGKFLRGLETSIEVLQNNTQNTLQQ